MVNGHRGTAAPSLLNLRTFLVITGTSQGYGACLAQMLAPRLPPGSTCLLLSRNPDKVADLQAPHVRVYKEKLDQGNLAECSKSMFQALLDKNRVRLGEFQQVMVIHNAGVCGDLTKYTWQMDDAGRLGTGGHHVV